MAIVSNFPEKRGLNTDDINDIANGEISNGFVQSGLCYSAEEQVVGKWVDGKPLYQKTITTTNAQCSSDGSPVTRTPLITSFGITNDVDNLWIDFGNSYKRNSSAIGHSEMLWSYNVSHAAGNNAGTMVWPSNDGNGHVVLNIRNTRTDQNNCTLYITLRYTKKTD